MHRLSVLNTLALLGTLVLVGCEAPSGALEQDIAQPPADEFGGDVVWTPNVGDREPSGSSYVLGPEQLAVFVGESLVVDFELLEPELFSLRAGLMPEEATFTSLPAGAMVQWEPGMDDVGTHEIVLLVVDAAEPNLVISQEMFVVDVLPRLKFIEYGF